MSLPWLRIWEVILTFAVIASTAVTVFIITLPTSYVHFHPGHLTESDFSDDDRKNEERSGYQFFRQHADETGRYATKTTVQVVVLGDIGRSPRMQYHALSLAKHGVGVQLIGYNESEPHPDVTASRLIKIVPLSGVPSYLQSRSKILFLLLGPLKALFQTLELYRILAFRTSASRYMLVQNPPSIPVLAVAVFVCFFRNTKLVIDWHNFGYSILALRLGSYHPLVKISRWYEAVVSRAADAHFTVTRAMSLKVKEDFRIDALTLHDRPAQRFQPSSEHQREAFLRTCEITKKFAADLKQHRMKLLVSSTSWTADEDFGVLLEALVAFSNHRSTNTALPRLLVVITGKGPQKQGYESKIQGLVRDGRLANIEIRLAWLSLDDYASLLAAADLGICLHTSSSGVDLPMKVLDMFGAGLPVAAWSDYRSWSELIHEGTNGVGFKSATELSNILESMFVQGESKLQTLREGAMNEGQYRWDEEWEKVAAKVFRLN